MPTHVSYIRCDFHGCDGNVQFIAKTQDQWNRKSDSYDFSSFYCCAKCGKIYIVTYGRSAMEPYKGLLTKNEILAEIPKIKGYFNDIDDNDENEILIRLRPRDLPAKEYEAKVDKTGRIYVGQAYSERRVKITVSLVL